jgi:hypothetical protein
VKFLYLLLILCATAHALDREAFTFTHYDLDVRVEPSQQRLAVRGKITLRNDSDRPQRVATLQISSPLAWLSIKADGKPLQFVSQTYTSDIDHTGQLSEALATLPREIAPGAAIELEVGYDGTVPLDAGRLAAIGVPAAIAKHTDWDQIAPSSSAVRGLGYVAWYPVATNAADLADDSVAEISARWKSREAQSSMNINLCADIDGPGSPMLLMNDPPRTEGEGGGYDRHACRVAQFSPLGAVVPAFFIASYAAVETGAADIFYLPSSKPAAEAYQAAVDLVAPFVREWFGSTGKARIIQLADSQASPYESGSTLITPLSETVDSRQVQQTLVHQMVHASFSSPRSWIYEGLAHFAQAAFIERQSGRPAALDFMALHRQALLDAEQPADAQKPADASQPTAEAKPKDQAADRSEINTSSEEFYRTKAMYFWWMLRDMLGGETLKKVIAAYRPEQDKEPSYVQKLVEAQTRRDLEWFFDDWVYRDYGLPDFRVESVSPRQNLQGGYLVAVTVENLGGAGAEVPVTVRAPGGEVSQRLEVRARSKATFRVESRGFPAAVVVNDGSVPESDMTNNSFTVKPPAASQ